MASEEKFEVMIGLEVHIQLTSLKTKMFCGCSSDYRGKPPNTYTCPVCLALPGTLPVLNKKAVDYAIRLALAVNSKVNESTFFFRKNYYYPDMAKNFQISQYDKAGGIPIASGGQVMFAIGNEKRTINLTRLHMEEDPGRLTYEGSITTSPYTLVDYNRHGSTLIECVTEPELRSPEEARAFLKKLRSIIEHLEIGNMGLDGAMRCDANISYKGHSRVEVKNISSAKEVERALKFEMMRQKQKINAGVEIIQETRHWDDVRRVTMSLRTKETEMDYRYFPEPDLVPISLSKEMLAKAGEDLPELPDARRQRFIEQYEIPAYDAEVLVSSKSMADFFEKAIELHDDPKNISNWLMGDVSRRLNEDNLEISETQLIPENLVEMLKMIDSGQISGKIGKKLIKEMLKGEKPSILVKKKDVKQISDISFLNKIIDEVFAENQKVVEEVVEGTNPRAIEYLIGQVMKKTRGQADPEITRKLIRERIDKIKRDKEIS
ncbi:MAG: Asp-tRNA(Asn)/Glu-tRNA(Gln) amidotransferase subunit GatB [Candidatus Hodarchaeota archaeon]